MLVVCKISQLVPIKKENIPRLELLGCLLLPKLIKSVCEAVGAVVRLSEIYCWSDAQIRCGGLNRHIKPGRHGFRTELM